MFRISLWSKIENIFTYEILFVILLLLQYVNLAKLQNKTNLTYQLALNSAELAWPYQSV